MCMLRKSHNHAVICLYSADSPKKSNRMLPSSVPQRVQRTRHIIVVHQCGSNHAATRLNSRRVLEMCVTSQIKRGEPAYFAETVPSRLRLSPHLPRLHDELPCPSCWHKTLHLQHPELPHEVRYFCRFVPAGTERQHNVCAVHVGVTMF